MSEVYDPDGHVRTALALHVLGALPSDQGVGAADHLTHCAACRVELRELREVSYALSFASAEDLRAMFDAERSAMPTDGSEGAGDPAGGAVEAAAGRRHRQTS